MGKVIENYIKMIAQIITCSNTSGHWLYTD